jgi:hypothetical protein
VNQVNSGDPIGDREQRGRIRAQWLIIYGANFVVIGNVLALGASAATVVPDTPAFTVIAVGWIAPALLVVIGLTMFLFGLAGILKHRG